jgi:FAD/FMN-containing dehydrogenase
VFRDDDEARAVYSEAAGVARALPRAVAVPADADDVRALVRWAAAAGAPLVPRGAGSSMAGGAVGDGVAVDLSGLAALGAVDAAGRRVACGPGVTGAAVDRAARAAGLRFPVDPSSWSWATVGGMAATNAAGAHSLRHGAMRPWVRALDCVFADGSRAVVRRGAPPPDVPAVRRFLADAGPARARGRRRRRRARPRHAQGVVGLRGGRLAALGRAGRPAGRQRGDARRVRRRRARARRAARRHGERARRVPRARGRGAGRGGRAGRRRRRVRAARPHLPRRGRRGRRAPGRRAAPGGAVPEAVLLAEVEAADAAAAAAAARALGDAFRAAGAAGVSLALDAAAEHALWELRHAASPILARLDPALKSMQFVEDGCVPPGRLAEYVRGVRAALARQGMRGVIFGHAGTRTRTSTRWSTSRRPGGGGGSRRCSTR